MSATIDGKDVDVTATRVSQVGNASIIQFDWNAPDLTFASIIDAAGVIPIPPYLNRDTEASDSTDYQTVFSRIKGSVAAPTAGLHFTGAVLDEISRRGIPRRELTLHVGAGTFQPVKEDDVQKHQMHSEFISVTKRLIEELMTTVRRVYAVGTTSVRTLESLYHIGCLISEGKWEGEVPQWYPYSPSHPNLSVEEALGNVLDHINAQGVDRLVASTRIIISPGYTYRIVKGMITNFHQPKSTLLLLVSAFIGEAWRSVYEYALAHDYRFLSYGDACLFEPACAPPAKAAPHDDNEEIFPVVDESGQTIGQATRGECHSGKKLLHPVVHLHVFDPQGRIYLQKRPQWKDIQPGKWDTAVGGHLDYGEALEDALRRETREELNITELTPDFVISYVFESAREREYVNVFRTIHEGDIHPSAELDGGRFWTREEVEDAIGKGILTPNFEQEYVKCFGKIYLD